MKTTEIVTKFATIPTQLHAGDGMPVPTRLSVEGKEIVALYDNGFVLRCGSLAVLQHVTGLRPGNDDPARDALTTATLEDLEWERSYSTRAGVVR